jgi:exosortase
MNPIDPAATVPSATTRRMGRRPKNPAAAKSSPATCAEVAQRPVQTPASRIFVAAALLVVGLAAYWPTLVEMVRVWWDEPDYSHGFLVVPAAAWLAWARRGRYPGLGDPAWMLGLTLLGLSWGMRYAAARFYMDFLDAYSLAVWAAGLVALVGGGALFRWALPSLGLLWFMVPLPYGVATALSGPLQRVATKLACLSLQTLGQPAIAEGNVILLGEHQLEVAQACSGLRLFVCVVFLAYLYVALVRRAWWEKLVLVLAIAPIAIVANVGRIAVTGLLYRATDSARLHQLIHDLAGFLIEIPLAAALFGLVLWYLDKAVQEVEVLDVSALVRPTGGQEAVRRQEAGGPPAHPA